MRAAYAAAVAGVLDGTIDARSANAVAVLLAGVARLPVVVPDTNRTAVMRDALAELVGDMSPEELDALAAEHTELEELEELASGKRRPPALLVAREAPCLSSTATEPCEMLEVEVATDPTLRLLTT